MCPSSYNSNVYNWDTDKIARCKSGARGQTVDVEKEQDDSRLTVDPQSEVKVDPTPRRFCVH